MAELDAWVSLLRDEPRLAKDLVARVRRGAALLDRVEPGWHRRIAADRLAMDSCDRCVLGQLHGDFRAGFWAITRPLPSSEKYSAATNGFTLHNAEQLLEADPAPACVLARWAALASLWRREVLGRLGKEATCA